MTNFKINKIEFSIEDMINEKNFTVEFIINFGLYRGQNTTFQKYIKNKIKNINPWFTRFLSKSKNTVTFGIQRGGDDVSTEKYYELFLNCTNKTYLLMLSNNHKDWLYNMFLEIFLEIDVDDYTEIELGENWLQHLAKSQ